MPKVHPFSGGNRYPGSTRHRPSFQSPYNVYESKRSIINVKYPDNIENIIQEKQKGITLSNKIEKNKMPIFIKKILIENDLRQKKYSDN